jgi:ABC-type transport system involved in multi-copper enzyme maturation permease subunit
MKGLMLPRFSAIGLISRGVWLELLRRQDLYVCGMIMMLFLLGVVIVRIVGIDTPATGTFMLNMGMGLSAISAHVLLLLLAIRQFPSEIENRTLYPMLARPVRRSDVVLSKWLAVSGCGIVVYVVLTSVTWLSVPKLEPYDGLLLMQVLLFQCLSLGVLAGLAILFSLVMPRGIAMLLGILLYFAGAGLRRFAGQGTGLLRLLAGYIPDFGKLDLTTRYTDGIPALSAFDAGLLLAYAVALVWASVLLAMLVFERRRL